MTDVVPPARVQLRSLHDRILTLCKESKTTPDELIDMLMQDIDLWAQPPPAKRKKPAVHDTDDEIQVPWLKKRKTEQDTAVNPPEPRPKKKVASSSRLISLIDAATEKFSDRSAVTSQLRKLLDRRDHLHRSVLHWAASAGNVDLLRLLLSDVGDSAGCLNVNDTAKDNMQAIHFAAAKGHLNAVKALVALGAKVNAATGKGSRQRTSLELAEKGSHDEVAEWLRGRGGRLRGEFGAMMADEDFQNFLSQSGT